MELADDISDFQRGVDEEFALLGSCSALVGTRLPNTNQRRHKYNLILYANSILAYTIKFVYRHKHSMPPKTNA